jgi:hypothetical protein
MKNLPRRRLVEVRQGMFTRAGLDVTFKNKEMPSPFPAQDAIFSGR